MPTLHQAKPTFKNCPKKLHYNLAQQYPYMPSEIPCTFSSTRFFIGCCPNLPSYKLKVGTRDTLNQFEFKDSQQPWPNDSHVNVL